MVEHRTENSGVGGSIPFIGRVQNFIVKNLLKQSTRYTKQPYALYLYLHYLGVKNCLLIGGNYSHILTLGNLENSFREVVYNNKKNLFSLITKELNIFINKPNLYWWCAVLDGINARTKVTPTLTNYFWFLSYLQLYLVNYTGYKFNWQFVNIMKTIKNSFFILWWHKLYSDKVLKSFYSTKINFFYILTNIIFFKNIDFFVKIVQKILINTPIKKHKKHFYQVKSILSFIFKLLRPRNKMLGYSIFFKGKLGRKGSVKKSSFFYKFGRVSLANKSLRVNYRKFLVYTETGVIGCCIHLFF